MRTALGLLLLLAAPCFAADSSKPPISFDEFFNATGIDDAHISPDGRSVVIETERADWEGNRYQHEIWLWREGVTAPGAPIRLTRSGYDHGAQWSPDGRWIAFLSDRPKEGSEKDKEKGQPQIWLIAPDGGEAFALTTGEEGVHSFSWSAASTSIFYSSRIPWTKEQEDAHKKEWNDVIRFRESERGDVIREISIASAVDGVKPEPRQLAQLNDRVSQLSASPDGTMLAVATDSVSERVESAEPWRLSVIDLPSGQPRLLSHAHAIYERLQWTPDSKRILFQVVSGSLEGPYRDVQPRLYSASAQDGKVERWGSQFPGAISGYAVTGRGDVISAGLAGTQTRIYRAANAEAPFTGPQGWQGTYGAVSAARKDGRIAFVYSSLERPTEVYLADSGDLDHARAITSFSHLFTERALPQGKPYHWKADDGAAVEGMLIYPPGKFEQKNLRMLTLIHGGPADADGDKFGADWYDWAILAASRGWLVFRPNYRGSIGYGDRFALETTPHIVSRPGKDILEGVDALVKDGIADPGNLTIGGYSEGGYLTNWLITQTTRFKAAVTGAGAVEHVADWGNDDETLDDAFYLGGFPWEAQENYNAEAAIWQIAKVKTPTHMVVGAEDIRVPFQESYLLERALHLLGVPCTLLVFPGEGHPLKINPWHGKIKVREELKWLEKYSAN